MALCSTLSARSSVKACVSDSCGLPAELPSGKSLNRNRGTPAGSTMSFAAPMMTVAIPPFECRRDQAHGLVADGSRWPRAPRRRRCPRGTRAQDFGRVDVQRVPLATVGRHAMEPRRQRLDAASAATARRSAGIGNQLFWSSDSVPGRTAMGRPACRGRSPCPGIDRVELGAGVVGRPGDPGRPCRAGRAPRW